MTASRTLLLSLTAICLIAGVPARAADDASARIQAPVSRFDGAFLRDFGAPELRWENAERELSWEDPTWLSGALEELLSDEVEAAGGSIHASNEDVIVDGGAEVVDMVRRRVAELDVFVEGRATLRIAAVHVDDMAATTSPAAVRTAIAEGGARVIWSGRVASRRGEPVLREDVSERSMVADLDVEVASSASIADPLVATLVTGWRLGVQQRGLDADRVVVSLAFQLSDVQGWEMVEVGSGTFERPRVPFVACTVPLVVHRDHGEVVVVDHPWKSGSVAVVVEVVDMPVVSPASPRLVDVAAHALAGAFPVAVAAGLDDVYLDEEECASPYEGAQRLLERIVDADAGLELSPGLVALNDPAFVLPDPRPRRLMRRTWRLPRVELEALPGYDPLDGSLGAEAEQALLARPSASWLSLTAAHGARTMHHAGIWTRVVTDFDVEIADSAAITDPIVYSFVDGDLLQISHEGVTRAGDVTVDWWAARRLPSGTQPLTVRKDIEGRRSEEQGDRIDVLHHRMLRGRVQVRTETPAEVRLLGDMAEVDLWARD